MIISTILTALILAQQRSLVLTPADLRAGAGLPMEVRTGQYQRVVLPLVLEAGNEGDLPHLSSEWVEIVKSARESHLIVCVTCGLSKVDPLLKGVFTDDEFEIASRNAYTPSTKDRYLNAKGLMHMGQIEEQILKPWLNDIERVYFDCRFPIYPLFYGSLASRETSIREDGYDPADIGDINISNIQVSLNNLPPENRQAYVEYYISRHGRIIDSVVHALSSWLPAEKAGFVVAETHFLAPELLRLIEASDFFFSTEQKYFQHVMVVPSTKTLSISEVLPALVRCNNGVKVDGADYLWVGRGEDEFRNVPESSGLKSFLARVSLGMYKGTQSETKDEN